jgi:hypothetical protein
VRIPIPDSHSDKEAAVEITRHLKMALGGKNFLIFDPILQRLIKNLDITCIQPPKLNDKVNSKLAEVNEKTGKRVLDEYLEEFNI